MNNHRGDPETRRRILEAAQRLLDHRSAPPPSMQAIADEAGVSRQALYLHFRDRADLLVATVDHIDRTSDLEERVAAVWARPSGVEALEAFVELVASTSPRIADIARTLDSARVSDPDLEAAWQDRMASRRAACRTLVTRLAEENRLRPEWTIESGTDVLWEITSPRTWEDFIVDRGWSAEDYTVGVTRILRLSLTLERGVDTPVE